MTEADVQCQEYKLGIRMSKWWRKWGYMQWKLGVVSRERQKRDVMEVDYL